MEKLKQKKGLKLEIRANKKKAQYRVLKTFKLENVVYTRDEYITVSDPVVQKDLFIHSYIA